MSASFQRVRPGLWPQARRGTESTPHRAKSLLQHQGHKLFRFFRTHIGVVGVDTRNGAVLATSAPVKSTKRRRRESQVTLRPQAKRCVASCKHAGVGILVRPLWGIVRYEPPSPTSGAGHPGRGLACRRSTRFFMPEGAILKATAASCIVRLHRWTFTVVHQNGNVMQTGLNSQPRG